MRVHYYGTSLVVWFSLNGRYRAYYWTGAEGRVARNSVVILVKEEDSKGVRNSIATFTFFQLNNLE